MTFQIRVKYRKIVFGPQPEVLPVWLRDLNIDRNTSIDHFHRKLRPLEVPSFFAWALLNKVSYAPTWPYESNITIKRKHFQSSLRWQSQNFSVPDPKNSFCVIIWYIWKKFHFENVFYSGGPVFCNFRTRKSYKIKGTLQNYMKTASFRIKKVWKFRNDPEVFSMIIYFSKKWSYFFLFYFFSAAVLPVVVRSYEWVIKWHTSKSSHAPIGCQLNTTESKFFFSEKRKRKFTKSAIKHHCSHESQTFIWL